ncbi:hypothetical protein EON62_00325, partial [archaeon]
MASKRSDASGAARPGPRPGRPSPFGAPLTSVHADDDDSDARSVHSQLTDGAHTTASQLTFDAVGVDAESLMLPSAEDVAFAHDATGFDDAEPSADDAEPEVLPEYACTYCHVHNPGCVVKCVATGKWFCNGRGNTSAAHIVQHLVRSKHKEVALHPDSALGDSVLECYNCGCRNVFILGFIPSSKQAGVVVLLCREPCLTLGVLRDQGWDLTLWQPIIVDRAFLPWLVKVPTDAEEARARTITAQQIVALETAWRTRPTATLEDLETEEGEGAFPMAQPVTLRFEDGYQYQNVFGPLVKLEADESKLATESLREEGITVRWETNALHANRVTARFRFARPDSELRVVPGDTMRLKLPSLATQLGLDALIAAANAKQGVTAAATAPAVATAPAPAPASSSGAASRRGGRGGSRGGGAGRRGGGARDGPAAGADDDGDMTGCAWSGTGVVKDVTDGEITLQLKGSPASMPLSTHTGYIVELVWRSVTFDRMQIALRNFAVNDKSVSSYLYHALLGQPVAVAQVSAALPSSYNVPGLPVLNHSQIAAVRTVLQRPLSLIQGPPGTGKTVTSATIVYHLSKQGQGQVLVAAPSNVAVDHLTEKIAATGLKVVRIVAKSRETVATSVDHLSLHTMTVQVGLKTRPEFRRLYKLMDDRGQLGEAEEDKFRGMWRAIESEILATADVICTTCAGAGDRRLEGLRFKQVLVDEATQACEPECLIPIVMGAKQLVLVGDHCQLGPVVLNKAAAAAGFNQSLFERLIMLGIRPIRLQVQYRMHPCLSEFPSNTFYEGSLQNGVTLAERACPYDIAWPVTGKPMYFYVSTHAEEISASGTSFLNRGEAASVERVVTQFLRSGVSPAQIGVITPYEGQRAYTVAYMIQHGALKSTLYHDIEVASVDSFQGREKDYIILSCVRSNEHQGIGFLHDPRRLNVALTRAKYGLIIIGNPRVLAKQPLWYMLVTHFKMNDCLVEGPFNSLKKSALLFTAPKTPYIPRTNLLLQAAMAAHAAADAAAAQMAEAGPYGSDTYATVYPKLAGAAAAAGGGADTDSATRAPHAAPEPAPVNAAAAPPLGTAMPTYGAPAAYGTPAAMHFPFGMGMGFGIGAAYASPFAGFGGSVLPTASASFGVAAVAGAAPGAAAGAAATGDDAEAASLGAPTAAAGRGKRAV